MHLDDLLLLMIVQKESTQSLNHEGKRLKIKDFFNLM